MQRTKYLFAFFCFFCFFCALANQNYDATGLKHQILLKEKFDTSYWRRYWSDDLWHIQCIFVDIDGDGEEEMIASTTSDEDRTGHYWHLWKNKNGKFKKMKMLGDIYFSCYADSFYKVKYKDGTIRVLGLGMNANIEKELDNGNRIVVRSTPNCIFNFFHDNSYKLTELETSIDEEFRGDNLISIERLCPEWYFGFDFIPPKKMNPVRFRMPYTAPVDSLYEYKKDITHLKSFISEYRKNYKFQRPVVYAVLVDADNDGDMDCYISTNHDVSQNGKLQWVLYTKNDKNYFLHDTHDKKSSVELPGKVAAGTNAFCRVVYQQKTPVFFVITEESKLKPATCLSDLDVYRVEKLPVLSFEE